MKDNEKVKFVFSCEEKHSADLKIRLRYDGISQTSFFCAILELYITGDPVMIPVLDKIKQEKINFGRKRVRKWKEDISSGESLLENLGITKQDKQKIFDIIENDLGEKHE